MLSFLLTIAIHLSLGLGILSLFPAMDFKFGRLGYLLLAYPVGLAGMAFLSVVTAIFGLHFGYLIIGALSLVGLVFGIIGIRKVKRGVARPGMTGRPFIIWVFVAVLLAVVAVTAYNSVVLPETGYDSMGIWTIRARMIAHHDGYIRAAWDEYIAVFGDLTRFPPEWPMYPSGWPFAMSWVTAISGNTYSAWPKVLNLVNWLAIGLVLMALLWRKVGWFSIIGWALFSLGPLFHNQAFAGYAELPMILLLFAGFFVFVENRNTSGYILGGLLLGAAMLIKNEGLFFAMPIAAVIAYFSIRKRDWVFWAIVPGILILFKLFGIMFDNSMSYRVSMDLFDLSLGGFFGRFSRSIGYIFSSLFLQDNFGIVPHLVVLLPIVLIPFKMDRREWFSVAIIGIFILEFAFMGGISPERVYSYYGQRVVIERFCMNLFPYFCYLSTVFVASGIEKTFPDGARK